MTNTTPIERIINDEAITNKAIITDDTIKKAIYDNNNCDFHIHTYLSDGNDSPKDIVDIAKENGLTRIAITDHDTTDGYFIAKDYIDTKGYDITIVPGVEISCSRCHILGHYVNPNNALLQHLLTHVRDVLEERTKNICDILIKDGYPVDFFKLKNAFPETTRLSKVHIAKYMMHYLGDIIAREINPNANIGDVLRKYLSDKKIDLLETNFIDPKLAIEVIKIAGGKSYLAHAFKDITDFNRIDKLVNAGLNGFEMQPNYGDKNIPYARYALERGLNISHGSDYHRKELVHRPMLKGKIIKDKNIVLDNFPKLEAIAYR